jgi:UPF0716 protein FxsA
MAPFPVFFLLFLAIPLLEIYFLVLVGSWIGALPTVLIVILTAVAGAALARQQGFATLQRVQLMLANGEMPALELLEGVILLVGALLLLTPGFITDLAGFVCLIPASRRQLALWTMRHLNPGVTSRTDGPAPPSPRRKGYTLEGEFHREDD